MHLDFLRKKDTTLPAASSSDSILSMRIWHCAYKSFENLATYINLEQLVIAGYQERTLEVIASLSKLRYLKIVHLPHVNDLSPLTHLVRLESLSLATLPSWDQLGRVTMIASLEPITVMRSLRHLELFGICPPDRSLEPLELCSGLLSARFSQFPSAVVEKFYAATRVANDFNPAPDFERGGAASQLRFS